jgi:hypothetical protein
MSTSNASSAGGTSSYPSYNALRKAHQPVRISLAAQRLYWTFQGPLSTAVTVMDEDQNPDAPREAYFSQTLAGTSWHSVAQEAFTEPKVSSITVTIDALEN